MLNALKASEEVNEFNELLMAEEVKSITSEFLKAVLLLITGM